MKLTYDQKIKIYKKLAAAKNYQGELIIETLPSDGVWLGNDFYALNTLVDALLKRMKEKSQENEK